MAETSAVGDSTRGIPYYEKLRRDLREILQKKRNIDQNLATLEDQIYRQETAYLEDTAAGNIIRGFDNYVKNTATLAAGGAAPGGPGTSTRRKGAITDTDRLFSRSSALFARDGSPGAAEDTPVEVSSRKKKATQDDDDDVVQKAPKRLKITYARGGVND